ncbi:MAG: OmpA family protein [Spirochaetaceae bacterium]|jgi:outer membrane protein OmpA-like peptidoglycan-associated protein/flagellar hook assembly protein FlgD|nr:OmpA family protein [Spirochaetaceae bacterium]
MNHSFLTNLTKAKYVSALVNACGGMKKIAGGGKKFFCALFLFAALLSGNAEEQQSEVYYFSPNGDGKKDLLSIPFAIKDSRFIKEWQFIVTDAAGVVVYSKGEETKKIDEKVSNYKEIFFSIFKPKQSVRVPPSIRWDGMTNEGKLAPDGNYYFYFLARDDNDNYSETMRYRVVLDTKPPEITIQQPAEQDKFFGTGTKKTLAIRQSGSREDQWIGVISDSAGKAVRHFEWADSAPANLVWDGKDDKGMIVPAGDYSYAISAVDRAENQSPPAGVTGIRFETIVPQAEAGRSAPELAPHGRTKSEVFHLVTNLSPNAEGGNKESGSWSFSIVPDRETGAPAVKEWKGSGAAPRATIEWDGKTTTNSIAEGAFKGILEIKLASGAAVQAETPPFISTGLAPKLDVKTAPPLFSPDGDKIGDELDINLAAQSQLPFESWSFVIYDHEVPFWTRSGGADVPQKLIWNGRGDDSVLVESATNYPYIFTVTDSQGQRSEAAGSIQVDVLIIRDGDKLRMRVPAIIFRANNADFVDKTVDKKRGLDQTTIDNNERVLSRVAEILQKFPDYKVRIEGHANSETGTAKEEQELIPLSRRRAQFVQEWLVRHGTNAARLSADGLGGKDPVMKNRGDRANWWKNRRVEFVLER